MSQIIKTVKKKIMKNVAQRIAKIKRYIYKSKNYRIKSINMRFYGYLIPMKERPNGSMDEPRKTK